jgi:hypothetical protein
VIATMPHFYAFFLPDLEVAPGPAATNLPVVLSPLLNPGAARAVLRWGAAPKDLDSYLYALPADAARPACLVSYKKKKCER